MKVSQSLLILLIVFNFNFYFGQKEIKIKQENENKTEKEIFYVISSQNSTIKNGSYKKYKFKDLTVEGFYKNNKKDSLWIEYHFDGKKIKRIGNYKNDLPVGEWKEYYYDGKTISLIENFDNGIKNGVFQEFNQNGELKTNGTYSNGIKTGIWSYYTKELFQKFNFDNKKLIYFNSKEFNEDDFEYKIINGNDTISEKLDSPCMYLGGMMPIFNYIAHNVNYPMEAIENEITGKVYITFKVNADGIAYDHQIARGIDKDFGCNKEALRAVQNLPNEWIPAIFKGKPVEKKFMIPITFNIQ